MAPIPTADELREKYAAERAKRLRADGNDQYIEASGVFADYVDDPYTNAISRATVVDTPETACDVAFVGAGFSGLVAGASLKSAGVNRVRLIDTAGDVGGTWYWNRYPGAQCDTASLIYMPLLEETGYFPSEKYVKGPEIHAHCQRIATHFGLYDDALLSTRVTGAHWDAEHHQWVITTDQGDEVRARHMGIGTGPLSKPKLPGLTGITDFAGASFHTSRWDYSVTGGSPDGDPMDLLADKRVGIIGTGATAVQCIPHLGRAAGELFVFQRTPSSIDVRNNHALDPDELAPDLGPGWQRRWRENFTVLQTGGFADRDLVRDGWTDIAQRIRDKVLEHPERSGPDALVAAYHESDDEKMNEIRSRVDDVVSDPATAEALKPWYRQLCKRPCFHDDYLGTYNRSNVHLVDTDGRGVESVTERGVIAAGREWELDVLIFASGFEVGTEFTRRAGVDPVGRDGLTLSAAWADGMVSFHGMHVHGFPNMYVIGHAQGANLISNVPHNLVEAAATMAAVIAHADTQAATEVEVTATAQAEWVDLLDAGGRSFGGDPTCTPGYYNNEGQEASGAQRRAGLGHPDGPVAYFNYIDQWRSTGEFTGLQFS